MEVSQTRPRASIIGLCGLAGASKMISSPQYGDGSKPGAVGNIDGTIPVGSRSGMGISIDSCRAVSVTTSVSSVIETP